MFFPSISPKQSFPALESEILAYWKANNTFKKSIESRPEENPYRFYDGPPFITGTPHYGSLLSSIVKDAVGRYWTMRGKRVDRVWGWDCHGLPIEEKVQKKLGLSSNREIEERGVKEFINGCYEYTQSTSAEWDWYIDKIGRWVDMDRAYRTMDQDYMESVMWVFKQLWDKGLIYEGKRVSLYSWKLSTPISNFEVAMDDTYQDVNDPAITVKFKVKNDKLFGDYTILAWTTTPWTIPANMALAIGENIDYVMVENNWERFVVAKNRIESVFKGKWDCSVIEEFKGSAIIWVEYEPPFPEYYKNKWDALSPEWIQSEILKHLTNPKAYFDWLKEWVLRTYNKVYSADFATDTDGTGIVHIAPEFGDVDFGLAKKYGIPVTEAMDEAGKYTSEIFDHVGLHYHEANKVNTEIMKERGVLFKNESITHRVPFCPRSGTPLVQRAQSSWFIDIQSQKDKLLAANEKINWFPEHLKYGRFAKGIESAPDWCISRTRFWWAPMPVWVGADGEKLVVGSREEIFELNKPFGQLEKKSVDGKEKLFFKWWEFDGIEFNLHKPYIDSILLRNPKAKKAKRVLGVHGWNAKSPKNQPPSKWFFLREKLENEGIHLDIPEFDKSEETTYWIWKNELDKWNVESYDTIVAASFGCPVILQYLKEKNIRVKRLVLQAPSGLKWNENLEKIVNEFDFVLGEIKNYCDELIVTCSKDDDSNSASFEYSKYFVEKTGANFIEVDGIGHKFNGWGGTLLGGLALYGTPLTRIPEVLDVWMDSGSMPYAQMHYPFANKEAMEASFPADFIAEYVGQVRAWFYVMHVLGVLLNPNNETTPTSSFTNVITTGVINGNDGRKMSKSYGNYPDPRLTIEKYGADPIRFYMLNSPLLSGGDMDFKEEGIVETIKSVMLPIWNTYSFFTTYANIDGWKKDGTEVWFSRHGESTSNVANKMSDSKDNPELTEKGREQARNAGKTLREQGKQFDVIIHTDRIRALDTARLIGEEIWFTGEYIINDGFAEQTAGEYANKTLEEIAQIAWISDASDHIALRKIYKNNSVENLEQFEKRIITTYEELLEKYKGKKILIVAHAGTPRPILANYMGMDKERANYDTRIANAEPFQLTTTRLVNPLDRWILSRLQVLIGQVHDAMDGYDISRACRAIVEYMDELTNWYVRLSRRRFWGSEMTADKASGYETLYTVLVELSKLLAPYMPFLAESIYKGLTDKKTDTHTDTQKNNDIVSETQNTETNVSSVSVPVTDNSVHLSYITLPNRHLVDADLNRDMEIAEHIVSLGLGLRSRKNIRVRQPLQSITITRELDEYYQSIIRDELNVKEVRFENPEKLAKKICKPDARKIGPKYGKDVQKVIIEAKNGNFIEKDSWVIDVWWFILENWEYTMEYIPLEWIGDVEWGYGMVIAMNTEITESLKLEGYARDIIRAIQDMRKDADYQVTDRISLHIYGENHEKILSEFSEMIKSETLSTLAPLMVNPDREKQLEINENTTLTIQIEK